MGQSYQPDFGNVIKGESIDTTEAEILAAVRNILTAEELHHPDIVAPAPATADRKSPAAHVIKRSLSALMPQRFRG